MSRDRARARAKAEAASGAAAETRRRRRKKGGDTARDKLADPGTAQEVKHTAEIGQVQYIDEVLDFEVIMR